MSLIQRQSSRLDPVLTEVIGNYFLSVAEEMGHVLVRTGYSSNIKERADCSAAIFDAQGETIAQASHIPVHLGSTLGLVQGILRKYRSKDIHSGDMFVANDPYAGIGSQLNDITIAAPVFSGGRLIAFVANIAHHSDVGGRFPGSESGESEHIFEEGLRLPILRIMERGQPRSDAVELIALNSRVPKERIGDVKAQIAANKTGVIRMTELCRRYTPDVVLAHMDGWLGYSERRIKETIRGLRSGQYYARDIVESSREGSGEEESISLRLDVKEDRLHFDFSGTSSQARNSRNIVLNALLSTVYYAAKALLDPDIPPNAGYFRAIEVHAPLGSLVNAVSPAAVAARVHTCQRVVDVIMAAFAQVRLDAAIAGCAGSKLIIISGVDSRTGEPFVDYEAIAAGLGARALKDGLDACRAHVTNSSNLPVETLEHEYPIIVTRYELLTDSGGPGRFRGGLGVRKDIKLLEDECEHTGWGLGNEYPGCGLEGGMRGRLPSPGMLVRNLDTGSPEILDPSGYYRLGKGDVLTVFTPGGGGFGNPLERDPENVLRDVLEGKVSAKRAELDYGVAIENGGIDFHRTTLLRIRK